MPAPQIVDVRALLVRLPLTTPLIGPFGVMEARHNLIAVVRTSGGIDGLGEVWANFPPWGCPERVAVLEQVIAPWLKGRTLDDPTELYGELKQHLRLLANQWGAPGPIHQALAGVDTALWDAHARNVGLPLSDVLADRPTARRVAVYASGIGHGETARLIAEARQRGHSRFKVRIAFTTDQNRAVLRAAREAAGDEALMADANQTLSPDGVRQLADDLRAARLGWLEEPFPVDDPESYRAWPVVPDLPLALGENARGLDGITAIMDDYDPAIVQPDITKTAGISEGIAIARAVVARNRRLCLHMFGGPIGLYASAHLSAAVEGTDWLEMDANPNPLYDRVVDRPPHVEADHLVLTGRPGLGVDLSPAIDARWAH
ncbi:MAG: mandelate racemase/muconate lactonizing enzyme family protein [Inquilinaceae bacterium]